MSALLASGKLAAAYRLLISGTPIPANAATDLVSVTVDEEIGAPSMFAFRLGSVKWSDGELVSPGNEVSVEMGYTNALQTLITGDIAALEPEYVNKESDALTVRGYDRRFRLMRGRKSRSFVNKKDSEIVSDIAHEAGLSSSKVDDTGIIHEHIMQHNQTDLDFVEERGRRIGFELLLDDRRVIFRRRRNTNQTPLKLQRATDLLEFRPRLAAPTQLDPLEVRAWDIQNGKSIVAQAGNSGTAGAVVDWPVRSQSEADELARSLYEQRAFEYITGDGVALGRTDLRAGTVVEFSDLGRRFRGPYYVTATRHSWSKDPGYRTWFRAQRNAS